MRIFCYKIQTRKMNYFHILKLSCFILMTIFGNNEAQSSTDASTSVTTSAVPSVKNVNEEKEVVETAKDNPQTEDTTKKTEQENKSK